MSGIYPLHLEREDVDPQAWLADVLKRLPDHPARRIADLLPWNWKQARQAKVAA
jgi:transposase